MPRQAACAAHGDGGDCANGVWMDHWASTRVSGGADLDLDPAGALAVCASAPARKFGMARRAILQRSRCAAQRRGQGPRGRLLCAAAVESGYPEVP